jgi:Cys-tRNA(Pro)/Cys-tRNA(Cys) deacylase
MRKTNSMRLLDARKIPYQAHAFASETRSAGDAANLLGVEPWQVYKTLVVVRERGRPLLVLAPGPRELNLKRFAAHLGEKRLRMASHKEAERLTGLQVGGISALALVDRGFGVYADQDILSLPMVYVSAGRRGINISLRPQDLLRVTGAQTIPLARSQEVEVE